MSESVILGTQNLPPGNASLSEVIAWCKNNRDITGKSDLGRAILKAIDSGQMKKLERYWKGRLTWP